jgi:hypothetical protein
MSELPPPTTSPEVRDRLVEALRLDLVGPWPGHEFEAELLRGWERPSNWYLTGFLVPTGMPPEFAVDADEDDDFGAVPENAGLEEENAEERKSAKKAFFPSSMGISCLVPKDAQTLTVTVCWGDYRRQPVDLDGGDDSEPVKEQEDVGGESSSEDSEGSSKKRWAWARKARSEDVTFTLPIAGGDAGKPVPSSGGLEIRLVDRLIDSVELEGRIPAGTRSVSIFLVNNRQPEEGERDEVFAFQAQLLVRCELPFVPRPDLRRVSDGDWDGEVADLHFAGTPEYATGHGVSATWDLIGGKCTTVQTEWIPTAEVERTETAAMPGVELSMEALGKLTDGAAARVALQPLVTEYRDWIRLKGGELGGLTAERRETAEALLHLANVAAARIEKGIEKLASDDDALDAFRLANRAVAAALQRRLKIAEPKWHAFQLAFVLVNVPGLVDPADPNRETVDLLFFPTGGGKTEAYLGLAAFAMVLRRLRNPGDDGLAGAGVSVVMRYTLRLLTLDQLGRAAGLVCALELERERDPKRYGTWPFEIGLWVGRAAAPNRIGRVGDGDSYSARTRVRQFRANPGTNPSPIPIEDCPWCGTKFEPDSFSLVPNDDRPVELRVRCSDYTCDFAGDRPLPIVAVDDGIYRRLPAFLIATLDKFASLPWTGQSGMLLGAAERSGRDGFAGPFEPRWGTRLSAPLGPPDLIIQDELHLISGPLGTIAGLYETAIDALCSRQVGGRTVRPKIVASTATARRAQDQVQALFGRALTQVFPPPGPDRRDSFFAQMVPSTKSPARLYLGVAAQGRNPKVMMRRAWLALMSAAQKCWEDAGGRRNEQNPADPYMSVLGYFNSLRELGGARRILEEEVQTTVKSYGSRRRLQQQRTLFRDRRSFSEVRELTSRESTSKVGRTRQMLGRPFHEREHVDCAIATNMISVGLDIQRLGLMVVLGQPKTHSEYIQATSRVGRDPVRPGLVVTLLNVHKPRDRSHYERFRHYHETFYRSVEVTSVTPYSARALDRAFAGALVAFARHKLRELTPALGAAGIAAARAELEREALTAFLERVRSQPGMNQQELDERLRSVQSRTVDLLDAWETISNGYAADGVSLRYQKQEGPAGRPLLHDMLEREFDGIPHQKFRANRSLRDVEPPVNLYIREQDGVAPAGADQ